ncbi:hypothetical protein O181_017618 [Austropuccinia psidii MF-1]|uniref:Uncharacterized protein n=1 Tax=Austropuccinia psidii MF-1 TaxID=1389203 RepID=A0A9Q3C6E3_9BASI|nr:hypothetical protein [Austropuccinia psidii MF-1]
MLVILADKHKKFLFVVPPFPPLGERRSCARHPCEDSFMVDNNESIPKQEWTSLTEARRRKHFWKISRVPSSINLSTTPLMVTSLLYWSKVIIQPMKHGNGDRTLELGPSVTMSCHPWDSNAKNKTHKIPGNKRPWFLVCLVSKLHSNQLQDQVAPNGQRTYSENPPNTMSHLFQA